MNLDFKRAVKDVFGLQYFWVYLFIFAVVMTLSSIFQSAENMPYHDLISKFISAFTYISSGYLFIMVHNLLNDNDLNGETFIQTFQSSITNGSKVFLGTLIYVFFLFFTGSIEAILATFAFIKITKNVVTEMNLLSFPVLNAIFLLIVLSLGICMLFVLKFFPVAYSEKYSLKDMFRLKKVFKNFFRKDKIKDTLFVISFYIFVILFAISVFWVITFLFNLLMVYLTKFMIINHYLGYLLLSQISNVAGPFLIGMFHFSIQGIIYHLLAQIYGRESL